MPDPKSGVAYTVPPIGLFAEGTDTLLTSPTLAAGDVKVSTDGSALANIASLPTVSPAASGLVVIELSASEMTGARISVKFVDQTSPKEWADVIVSIGTTAQTVDDLATQASVNTIDDFLDTEIAAILAAVDTEIGAILSAIAALNNLSAAQVNAEVVDALNVDTYAQPGQATPAATTTIRLMLAYLYKAWRNRSTQDATDYKLYNDDATTVDQKAAVSDAAGTTDVGEVATGP